MISTRAKLEEPKSEARKNSRGPKSEQSATAWRSACAETMFTLGVKQRCSGARLTSSGFGFLSDFGNSEFGFGRWLFDSFEGDAFFPRVRPLRSFIAVCHSSFNLPL